MIRRCSSQLHTRDVLTSGAVGQTTCGHSTLNLAEDYTIEDAGVRERSLSSKTPYISGYQPCNLSLLRTKSTKGSNRQASIESILRKAIPSDIVLRVQDKFPVSINNLLISAAPQAKLPHIPESSGLFSIQKKELLRAAILKPRAPVNMKKWNSSVNRDTKVRPVFPRQLQLLAQSPKVAPHPGDKDIPLITDHVGLLCSRISSESSSDLCKVTLELRSVRQIKRTRIQKEFCILQGSM